VSQATQRKYEVRCWWLTPIAVSTLPCRATAAVQTEHPGSIAVRSALGIVIGRSPLG
jgi:hypothetical protein